MSAVDAVLADDQLLQAEFAKLSATEQAVTNWQMKWLEVQAHKHQIEPSGDWWNIWLMLAGRGAGKTRAAAETLAWWAWEAPNTRWLVGAVPAYLKVACQFDAVVEAGLSRIAMAD